MHIFMDDGGKNQSNNGKYGKNHEIIRTMNKEHFSMLFISCSIFFARRQAFYFFLAAFAAFFLVRGFFVVFKQRAQIFVALPSIFADCKFKYCLFKVWRLE
jgi:hypothetical protein